MKYKNGLNFGWRNAKNIKRLNTSTFREFNFNYRIINNNVTVYKFSSFYNYKFENFSTHKIKLSDRIKVVDQDKIKDDKEDWGEILSIALEKEFNNKFIEQLEYITKKGILLSLSEINRVLSITYNKNWKFVDKIYNYILDNNIELDSISYNFLILSSLQFEGFLSAFNFFEEASSFNIPQNLTVIIALYKETFLLETKQEIENYQFKLEFHARKYFSKDAMK
jgi:hypothetical protein